MEWDPSVSSLVATRAFAARVFSTKGKRDGLCWATLPREKRSPLGPMLAEARPGQAYYGYQYRILTAQGANAPGGAKSSFRDGRRVVAD